jgi:dTDP-4-dehydrorhamnose 3,5-epimerase-like enzyme
MKNKVLCENGAVLIQGIVDADPSKEKTKTPMPVSEQGGMITIKPPAEEDKPILELAKKVITYDSDKKPNGSLIELFKDGDKTTTYLSTISPGKLKGYHLHKVREANYICLKGEVKIILYMENGRQEYLLSAKRPERLHIPANVPTALYNPGKSEAWIINDPSPAYDPSLKGEQVEYTEAECESKLYLKRK